MFRLSTMVFTEQTGLRNLYAMAAYCLDSERYVIDFEVFNDYGIRRLSLQIIRCRREVIASHFDERWESSSCNKMCDHCSQESKSTEMNITEHLITLSQILKRAEEQQVRVTGAFLFYVKPRAFPHYSHFTFWNFQPRNWSMRGRTLGKSRSVYLIAKNQPSYLEKRVNLFWPICYSKATWKKTFILHRTAPSVTFFSVHDAKILQNSFGSLSFSFSNRRTSELHR